MNILIAFTNIAFAAVLESAPSMSGPWVGKQTNSYTCPVTHSFHVPALKRAEFFRLRVLDNGSVQTPAKPHAVVTASNMVQLSCGMVFQCNDDSVIYRWLRNNIVIYEGKSWFNDAPGSGSHQYRVIAVDGDRESWSSEIVEVKL